MTRRAKEKTPKVQAVFEILNYCSIIDVDIPSSELLKLSHQIVEKLKELERRE